MSEQNLLNEYAKVTLFEQQLSNYCGSLYTVAVDSCTNALLLSFLYSSVTDIILPTNTYVGVAMSALHAKKKIQFRDYRWEGSYRIEPTNIYDSAKLLTSNMYIPGTLMCLSFHYKKHLKIGRGGAILTDSKKAYDWFTLARNSGRKSNSSLKSQYFTTLGYNMTLHPELAEKGSKLLQELPAENEPLPFEYYGDLSYQMESLL